MVDRNTCRIVTHAVVTLIVPTDSTACTSCKKGWCAGGLGLVRAEGLTEPVETAGSAFVRTDTLLVGLASAGCYTGAAGGQPGPAAPARDLIAACLF